MSTPNSLDQEPPSVSFSEESTKGFSWSAVIERSGKNDQACSNISSQTLYAVSTAHYIEFGDFC